MTTTKIKYERGDVVRWRGRLFTVVRHDFPAGYVYMVDDEGEHVSVHEGRVYPA